MTLTSLPDIVGSNSAVQLSSTSTTCQRIFLFAHGDRIRMGDSSVSATQGVAITNGMFVEIGPNSQSTDNFNLSAIWVYVPTGMSLSITYGAD